MNKGLGMLLTVIGALILILSVFTYKKKKKIIDADPIQVSIDQKQSTDWMPYAGSILFAGGIILLVTSRKSR
jgi:hypothetical protein